MLENTPEVAAPRFAPTVRADRIETLDVLRGFALLGILAMNIQSFSMPGAAYFFPVAYGDLEGANRLVWLLSEWFARDKFMTLFSLLFGAGIALMHDRATAAGRGWAGLHYRRIGVLWLFGMLHAYLLWDGDILVSYAVCGVFVFWFRGVRPRTAAIVGLLLLGIGSALALFFGASFPHWPVESQEGLVQMWRPTAEELAHEIAAMKGSWLDEIGHRWESVLGIHLFHIPTYMIWRSGGAMLLGIALYRGGWLTGQSRRARYVEALLAVPVLGFPLAVYGVSRKMASDWDVAYSFFTASQYNYWGSLLIALGYAAALILLVRAGALPALRARLAAVGRMAFTNYLLMTVLCTSIFYGRGLGLFGDVERVGQAGITVAVWIVLLLLSPWWLARFRMGPAEWLWRTLSYRRRPPMRRAD